ncbi:MAG: hypothetical protein HY255_08710, partial [Betaproteobacteria bacterium]|nr:hypothetical protein [Betaproteobacteria bacterium]
MQELDSLLRQVETLRDLPNLADLRLGLQAIKKSISGQLNAASQGNAPLFRSVLLALAGLPDNVEPALQAELALDLARYFYVAGLPFDALQAAKQAEALAKTSGRLDLVARAVNSVAAMNADTGNTARAVEKYSEAIETARAIEDKVGEATYWANLGVALHYCAEFRTALACFKHVVDMSGTDPALKAQRLLGLNNIALVSIHTDEFSRGLRAINDALSEVEDPVTAAQMLSRVLMERNAARLFLETGNLGSAKLHVERAKQYAALSKSPRAELEASIAEGLYLVYAGHTDVGLSSLKLTLERARFQRSSLRDVLIALVKAYEFLKLPEQALIYLREMMESNKKYQQDNILKHLKIDLKEVEEELNQKNDAGTALDQHEQILRGKIAEQELFKSRIEMLERLAVTAELRDDSTGEHSFRVGKLASLLAQEYGCDEDTIFMIDLAGRLH